MTYPVILPLPAKEVSPNASVHWGKKGKAVKKMRSDAKMMAMKEGLRADYIALSLVDVEIRISATYFLPVGSKGKGYCPTDDDNAAAALKAYRDGIADGIGVNDKRIKQGPVTIVRGKEATGLPRVEILVDVIEPEFVL